MIRSQAPSTVTAHDLARWRQSYCDEASGALLYRSLSELEPNPRIAAGLRHLAELERAQADHWASRLPAEARPERPDLSVRDRIILLLARRIGVRPVLPVLAADAVGSVQAYRAQPDAAAAGVTFLIGRLIGVSVAG